MKKRKKYSFCLIQNTALVSQKYSVYLAATQTLVYINRFYVFAVVIYSLYCSVPALIQDLLFWHFLQL